MYSYQVQVFNESGGLVADSGQVNQNQALSQSWAMSSDLAIGQKYRVTTRVNDGVGWSDWSASTWMMRNRPPVVNITAPTGSSASPTRNNAQSIPITWSYSDPDGHPQTHYRVRVYQNSNGALAKDSGAVASSANSWTAGGGFAYNTLYHVYVDVYDGYEWTTSSAKYFMTNAQSTPNLSVPSGVSAGSFSREARAFNVTWSYADPNSDPQNAYNLRIINQASGVVALDSGNVTSGATSRSVGPLTKNTLYRAELRTYDGYDWGVANTKYFFTNLAPAATVTFPSAASAASATGAPPPFTVTWNHSDPDGDAQTQYELMIYRASDNAVITNTGTVASSAGSYNVTAANGLAMGETYYVRVRTYDSESWSAWSAPKYFITNRPPAANFTWTPSPVHEGDTVSLLNASTDPDGNPMTHAWSFVSKPAGSNSTITNAAAANASFVPDVPGNYTIRLVSTDNYGASGTITRVIPVNMLSVTGHVNHTTLWDEHRQDYNLGESGNVNNPRAYDVYWAGEKFELRADTTNTGTTTRATRVTVQMNGFSTDLTADALGVYWSGSLYDESFEQLADGNLTFTFTAYYNNGVIKTDTVQVSISDNIYDYLRIHRVQ